MDNKIEKHGGFEDVKYKNIYKLRYKKQNRLIMYQSIIAFLQESPLYMFESEEAAVKFIREQYNEEWQITNEKKRRA